MEGSLQDSEVKIRLVRDVAPNKRMMRADFRVPEHVAFRSESISHRTEALQDSEVIDGPPSSKKLKLTEA